MTRVALLLTAVLVSTSFAADRIHRRVDPSRTVRVKGSLHSAAIAQNDLGLAPAGLPLEYVTIILKPAPGLEAFLAEQQNPGSPNYHRWLTPEQYGDRFGLSASDMSKVVAWLRSQNLQVH